MPIHTLLQRTEKFKIEAYKNPKDLKTFSKSHVSFTGSPQKHPHHSNKGILISDPFSTNTFYYEFIKEDISYFEELPNLSLLVKITPQSSLINVPLRGYPF